jgi:hypothetical protein
VWSIRVPVACRATLTPRLAGLIDRPFVCVTFLVSGLAAFACNASLFFWIHRCESTSSFLHVASSGTPVGFRMQEQRQRTAHVAGDQKVLSNVLVSLCAKRPNGHREPEAFTQALLYKDRRHALTRIDFRGAPRELS